MPKICNLKAVDQFGTTKRSPSSVEKEVKYIAPQKFIHLFSDHNSRPSFALPSLSVTLVLFHFKEN